MKTYRIKKEYQAKYSEYSQYGEVEVERMDAELDYVRAYSERTGHCFLIEPYKLEEAIEECERKVKYEYTVLENYLGRDSHYLRLSSKGVVKSYEGLSLVEVLDDVGRDGWRLVCGNGNGGYIMMREVSE